MEQLLNSKGIGLLDAKMTTLRRAVYTPTATELLGMTP
ncbi:MAG: hypothetical protein ACI8PP_002932 [Candidatus Pseudothioglobus sp.]|jgi:hypothetical protein